MSSRRRSTAASGCWPWAAFPSRRSMPLRCCTSSASSASRATSTGALLTRRADGALVLALWNYADVGAPRLPARRVVLQFDAYARAQRERSVARRRARQCAHRVREDGLAALSDAGAARRNCAPPPHCRRRSRGRSIPAGSLWRFPPTGSRWSPSQTLRDAANRATAARLAAQRAWFRRADGPDAQRPGGTTLTSRGRSVRFAPDLCKARRRRHLARCAAEQQPQVTP